MNNVVPIQGATSLLQSPSTSPLMFTAYERPLHYTGKNERVYTNTNHKALVRVLDDNPICLNVVRNTYKLVQNEELFEQVHKGFVGSLTPEEAHNAEIIDKVAYGGAQCFREYRFPEVCFASPDKSKIAFRVIVQNGFGTGAIKILAGAIDFYCTNGMVTGEYTKAYAKHTKGLVLANFSGVIRSAVDVFWKNRAKWEGFAASKLNDDKRIIAWLEEQFGDRLAGRLFARYMNERSARGNNLWALYSALTFYASHAEGDFVLRNTGNDHAAATMAKRESDIRKAVSNESFVALAA